MSNLTCFVLKTATAFFVLFVPLVVVFLPQRHEVHKEKHKEYQNIIKLNTTIVLLN